MVQTLSSFIRDEAGATAIEYGLIAALVSVSAISAMQALSGNIEGLFNVVRDSVLSAAS